ncbi:hypothetical protein GQ53DRAFT_768051 [Thozetella sp. PMI_491]|nr:hypothetical protein GQ53DRAFT_768051 [Thozetella sp. PMI_491]
MKTFLPIALLATAIAAQTTATGGDSSCAANYIVETCLGMENGVLAACGTTDYECQCNAYGALVTCFNNCPDDKRVDTYKGQQTIFCQYASQFPSSTTKANTPAATGSTAETTSASPTTSGSSTGTASNSAAAATKTNGASDLVLNAGGILAAVAGVVVAVL